MRTLTEPLNLEPAAISATYFSNRETPGRLTSSEIISPLAVTVVRGAVGKVTASARWLAIVPRDEVIFYLLSL